MKNLMLAVFVLLITVGCNSQKNTAADKNSRPQRSEQRQGGQKGQRPSIDEIFEMDTNKDGKLSKSEVKGPLQRDFSKIDADDDGFLTRTEVQNAPKPERRQRPPRG